MRKTDQTMSNAPEFQDWLESFFEAYYRRRPVNATFVGIHRFDDSLPDYSVQGAEDAAAEGRTLLARLRGLPVESLSEAEAIDRKLAEGFLEIQDWELRSDHFYRGNPCVYTGEAAFGIISLLRRPFAPAAERLESAVRRMEAIPGLLEQGRRNLRQAPLAWTGRAIDECAGALALLGDGIDHFAREHSVSNVSVRAAADRAAAATGAFRHYLETELRLRDAQTFACGGEALDLLIRRGHFLESDAAGIEAYAQEQFDEAESCLVDRAKDFGARSWTEALAGLADRHPSVDGYYGRYAQLWNDCRACAAENRLLSWPDYPVRYVPQPVWAREAAPHLYFLHYHSPAPFDNLPVLEYLVTPIEPAMPPERQEQLLRATNESVIKLNHVVHHGATGHHVQNWHAFRAASRIGRVAAVDCASRIALFCGGTMAEGWACYATDLMAEYGFLTPLEQYSQIHSRLRMAARAIVDVRLHRGAISLGEAEAFYRERVGMSPAAAHAEAVKNSMFPGTALMYLSGTDAIHRLRRELSGWPGFELRSFHDRFLSYGSIPVALIAGSMTNPPSDEWRK